MNTHQAASKSSTVVRLIETLEGMLFPYHCCVHGEWLPEPTILPGVHNSVVLSSTPAPFPHEIQVLVQHHHHADELMVHTFMGLWCISSGCPISTVIHAMKYGGNAKLAATAGILLAEVVRSAAKHVQYSMVIPVPLHAARKRERGYNQSDEIARGVATNLSVPLHTDYLRRNRYTGTQTAVGGHERKQNVEGAFETKHVPMPMLNNATVLLVDDVLTTGNTVNLCASALLNAGAKRVDVATLCVAV
jgi:ComF family protein